MTKSEQIELNQEELMETTLTDAKARKNLKRTWNQLPRVQRKLIVTIIAVMCFILLFLMTTQEMDEKIKGTKRNGPITTSDKKQSFDVNEQFVNNINVGNLSTTAVPTLTNIIAADPADDDNEEKLFKKPISRVEDRTAIETAIANPTTLPETNGVTIEEFLERIDLEDLPEKQLFRGANNERQVAVRQAFQHSWKGYKQYAWGYDNLKPITKSAYNSFGLGSTIIESLDTMYIMGLEEEFTEARNWVSKSLSFQVNEPVNLFAVSIRILGGLLSAYHLSADRVFLGKSIELGNRLLPGFLSPSGIPYAEVNLARLQHYNPIWSVYSATSEATTIQLEFRDLSRITGVSLYERVTHRINEKLHALKKHNGLVPIYLNWKTGTFTGSHTISLGACGDSYYEYLLKQWIQMGHKDNDNFLISDYRDAIDGVLAKLVRRTPKQHFVYIGEIIRGQHMKQKMDHLTCFLPGTLLLGHHYGMPKAHFELARDLLETCYQTYMKQPTQLAPEVSYFALTHSAEFDIYAKPDTAYNLLRPELIESLYYFYALTGNRTYQDMGWTIFRAFEKYAKVEHGYAAIRYVMSASDSQHIDKMGSRWLGETLKYFYLLFSDNPKEIDLDKWVFNSKAHPLPIRDN